MKRVTDTKDYSIRVNKDSNDEIGNLITGFNQMLEEIEDRNLVLLQRQEHLHQLAHFDSLTHLPNRSLFGRLSQSLNYCKRNNKVLSVMFIDLDHFKDINDTYGHRCGDLLLTFGNQVVYRRSCVIAIHWHDLGEMNLLFSSGYRQSFQRLSGGTAHIFFV